MIEWNKVIYADCMNEINGLPILPDKSVDLCLTDPPYNLQFKKLQSEKWQSFKIPYKDNLTNNKYKEWCYNWFDELKRVCKGIIFTPGYMNKQIWFDKEEFEIVIWVNMYAQGASKIAKLKKFELIFCYGEFNSKFILGVLKLNTGYNMCFDHLKLIHTCPKPNKLYNWIIKSTKPKSIIDPFMGSGTTAEVCTKLGIKWLGYEINEVYSQDINKRLKNCKKEPKQVTLI